RSGRRRNRQAAAHCAQARRQGYRRRYRGHQGGARLHRRQVGAGTGRCGATSPALGCGRHGGNRDAAARGIGRNWQLNLLDLAPMTYRAPVADIAFSLKHAAGFGPALEEGLYGDLAEDLVAAVLEEAGKFATDILGPLNQVGDRHGASLKDGVVTTAPGWKEASRAWTAAGWNAVAAPTQWGGQELPHAVNAACIEMWSSAAFAFGLGPLLTMAGVDALAAHGSDELQRAYLTKLVSGEWMGTMQLTEPQAGSDVGALRARAERAGDGSYRISGQKIFITYGEHDLTDNIIHFVLARLPDAPPGTKGISLFLVPKFLLSADGSLGARNDVR